MKKFRVLLMTKFCMTSIKFGVLLMVNFLRNVNDSVEAGRFLVGRGSVGQDLILGEQKLLTVFVICMLTHNEFLLQAAILRLFNSRGTKSQSGHW